MVTTSPSAMALRGTNASAGGSGVTGGAGGATRVGGTTRRTGAFAPIAKGSRGTTGGCLRSGAGKRGWSEAIRTPLRWRAASGALAGKRRKR
ncbi:hypothetical protein D3C86_1640880 [compost metagenome]